MNRRQLLAGALALPWARHAFAQPGVDLRPAIAVGDPSGPLRALWFFDPTGDTPRVELRRRAVTPLAIRQVAPSIWAADVDVRQSVKVRLWASDGSLTETWVRPFHHGETLRFAVGADLIGQGYGIDPARGGLRIFEQMSQHEPRIFLYLGDRIYADSPLPAELPMPDGSTWRNDVHDGRDHLATTLEDFRGAWRYPLRDEHYRKFLAETAMIAVWDDHEVTDNQGPGVPLDSRYASEDADTLRARGRQAMWEFTPWRQPAAGPFWRHLAISRHVDVFALDTRSHRTPVLGEASGADRLLGVDQATWLAERLAASSAPWQFILLSQPIGAKVWHDWRRQSGSDGPADGTDREGGREKELRDVLAASPNPSRIVVFAADVHCPGLYRYTLPGGAFHEVVTGALQAIALPPPERDPTFAHEILWQRPQTEVQPPLPRWQSFALCDVDVDGALTVRFLNGEGTEEFAFTLPNTRQPPG